MPRIGSWASSFCATCRVQWFEWDVSSSLGVEEMALYVPPGLTVP